MAINLPSLERAFLAKSNLTEAASDPSDKTDHPIIAFFKKLFYSSGNKSAFKAAMPIIFNALGQMYTSADYKLSGNQFMWIKLNNDQTLQLSQSLDGNTLDITLHGPKDKKVATTISNTVSSNESVLEMLVLNLATEYREQFSDVAAGVQFVDYSNPDVPIMPSTLLTLAHDIVKGKDDLSGPQWWDAPGR